MTGCTQNFAATPNFDHALPIQAINKNGKHMVMLKYEYFHPQFLEGMAEKIVQGIEAAETDLSKEKEQKSQEEVGPWLYKPH